MQSPIGTHISHWLTSDNALFAGDLECEFSSERMHSRTLFSTSASQNDSARTPGLTEVESSFLVV